MTTPARRVTSPSRGQYSQQVRIIGGQWKRSLLAVPTVGAARPSLSRVRTVLFDWLSHLLNGNWSEKVCLDVFAGSGALGFEAASRGASRVDLWEREPLLITSMQAAAQRLKATQLQIVKTDSLTALAHAHQMGRQWDVIFCDPPFSANYYASVLALGEKVLKPDGFLYCESASELDFSTLTHLTLVRQSAMGAVRFFLLQKEFLGHEAS